MDELRLSGRIVTTTDIYEDPAVLCSTVSTQNGQKHVYVDFHALADDDSVVREITQQLTAAENRPSEPADQKAREIPASKVNPSHDDANQKVKRDAKVEELKNRARNIVEQVRREERRKRGKSTI